MKKLSLESFFTPALPEPENKHQWNQRDHYINDTGNDFPYTDPEKEDRMSEDEITNELGLDEGYKTGTGPTMTGLDSLSIGKLQNSQGSSTGKSNKSFANFSSNEDSENIDEKEETRPQLIGDQNYTPKDDYEQFDKYFNVAESKLSLKEIIRGARDRATKEVGFVSTKSPWANGLPNSSFEEDPDEVIEREMGLSLESVMREYADTDWSVGMQGAKCYNNKDDLDFFDKVKNPYLMTNEEEFGENNEEE